MSQRQIHVPLVGLAVATLAGLAHSAGRAPSFSNSPSRVVASCAPEARLRVAGRPLTFEPNRGHLPRGIEFAARGSQVSLALNRSGAVLSLQAGGPGAAAALLKEARVLRGPLFAEQLRRVIAPRGVVDEPERRARLRMRFAGGAGGSAGRGLLRQPGTASYILGSDPASWRSGVPRFGRVRYPEVYPGVDVEYYGREGEVEFDFEVAPGADPAAIHLAFEGDLQGQPRLNPTGDLVVETPAGSVRYRRPAAYQEVNGERRPVACDYLLPEEGRDTSGVRFRLARYDASRPLVIDPIIASTYLGGAANERAIDIERDPDGNLIVLGSVDGPGFPVVNPLTSPGGKVDVFVTKYNADLTQVLFSTTFGGSGDDYASGLAVDGTGGIYFCGYTISQNYPGTTGAFQVPQLGGGFITKINADGTLGASTGLKGNSSDNPGDLDVAPDGTVFVVTTTSSTNLPTGTGVLQPQKPGPQFANSGYVCQFSPSLNTIIRGTYLGGTDANTGLNGIVVGPQGQIVVSGDTTSTTLPVRNAHQGQFGGGFADALIGSLDPNLAQTNFLTYVGGPGIDFPGGLDVGPDGTCTCAGVTDTGGLPFVNPVASILRGLNDGFVATFGADGAPQFVTLFGGSAGEVFNGVNSGGDVVDVAGVSASNDFPVVDPVQPFMGGDSDGVLVSFPASGTNRSPVFSTPVGGTGIDVGSASSPDTLGGPLRRSRRFFCGTTQSNNFPVSALAPQSAFGGGTGNDPSDGFVCEISNEQSGCPDGTVPDAPTNLIATVTRDKKVLLSWGKPGGTAPVRSYSVQQKIGDEPFRELDLLEGNPPPTTFEVAPPAPGQEVRYLIIAVNKCGNSAASNALTLTGSVDEVIRVKAFKPKRSKFKSGTSIRATIRSTIKALTDAVGSISVRSLFGGSARPLSGAVTVPESFTIPAGKNSTTITIQTSRVTSTQKYRLTATLNGYSQTADITITK